MENLLSDRIKNLSGSKTIELAAKGWKLISEGKDIISLTLGEPDFDLPDFIKEAAIKSIHEGYNTYSPIPGYEDLLDAVCLKFKRDNDLIYKPSQIIVSTGAKQCIANICLVLLNKGDEVILPAPYWVSYKELVKLGEGTPIDVITSIDNDFKLTPEELEAAITPKTKMVLFSSPCNPTGTVYSKEELRALANVLVKYPNIIVVSDEIYEHLIYEGTHTSIASFNDMFDRTVVINGLSKSHAMTGWRIGYIGAPEWITKACIKLQGQFTSGTNSIAQRAAITALKESPSKIKYMLDDFKKRRDALVTELNGIEGFKINCPKGAFYLMPDISYFFGKSYNGNTIRTASDFSNFILDEALVTLVPGESFAAYNCVRISYAINIDRLKEAATRIKKAISLLR